MNRQEVYNAWKEKKRQVDISEDFTDEMMNQIHQYEQKKSKSLFDMQRLIDVISDHPLAKIGLIAVGAVTGLVRLIFVIIMILNEGVING